MTRLPSLARGLAIVLYVAALWLMLRHAGAQEHRALTRDEAELATAIAKVAANEASLDRVRPAEVALIHQVTEAHGATPRARLRWLTAHSSCVLGTVVERPGNCSWTAGLEDDDAEPPGWSVAYPHLRWSRYAPRCRQVRELARRLVVGAVVIRPCRGTPWTWGGAMDRDRAIARGLVPLTCLDARGEPTRNIGFARRGDAS